MKLWGNHFDIKNSARFKKGFLEVNTMSNYILVSCDGTDIFTIIAFEETLRIIKNKWRNI